MAKNPSKPASYKGFAPPMGDLVPQGTLDRQLNAQYAQKGNRRG